MRDLIFKFFLIIFLNKTDGQMLDTEIRICLILRGSTCSKRAGLYSSHHMPFLGVFPGLMRHALTRAGLRPEAPASRHACISPEIRHETSPFF
jgi:hypothetical protein